MARQGFSKRGLTSQGRGAGIRIMPFHSYNEQTHYIHTYEIDKETKPKELFDDEEKKELSPNKVPTIRIKYTEKEVTFEHQKNSSKDFRRNSINQQTNSKKDQPKYLGKPKSMTTAVRAAKAVLKQLTSYGEPQEIETISEAILLKMSRDDMISSLYNHYVKKGSIVPKTSLSKKSDMLLRKDIRNAKAATLKTHIKKQNKKTNDNNSNKGIATLTTLTKKNGSNTNTLNSSTTDKTIDNTSKLLLSKMYLTCLQKTHPSYNQLYVKSLPIEKIRKELKSIRDLMHAIDDIQKKGPIPTKYNDFLKLDSPVESTVKNKNYYEMKIIMLLLSNKNKIQHKTQAIENMSTAEMKEVVLQVYPTKERDDSSLSIKQTTKKKLKIKQEIIDEPKSINVITAMTTNAIIYNMNDTEIKKAIIGYTTANNGTINMGNIEKMSSQTLRDEAVKIRNFQRSSPLKDHDEFDLEDSSMEDVMSTKSNDKNIKENNQTKNKSPNSFQKLLNDSTPYSLSSEEDIKIIERREQEKEELSSVVRNLLPTYENSKRIDAELDHIRKEKEIKNGKNDNVQPITQVEFENGADEDVKSTITKESEITNESKENDKTDCQMSITTKKSNAESQKQNQEPDTDAIMHDTIEDENRELKIDNTPNPNLYETITSKNQTHTQESKTGEWKTVLKKKQQPMKGKSLNPLKPSHNLNGVDLNDIIPSENGKTITNLISPNLAGNEIKVTKNVKTTYMLRVSMHIKQQNAHAPTMVKELLRTLRLADPTFNILPFDSHNKLQNQILDNEDSVPDDQNQMKTWVYGLQTTKNNRLKFSIRSTFTKSIKEVKGVTFEWCKQNKNFVVFDQLMSAEVFHAGWIIGVHPRFNDRDKLKKWLDECDDAISPNQYNLIPRKVYATDESQSKTITNAIAIDVAYEEREKAMKFLYQINWENSLYPEATFIPFRITSTFTINSQIGAMQLQNSYLHDTFQKVIRCQDATMAFQEKNSNNQMTLIDWIRKKVVKEEKICKQVESNEKQFVKLIYNKSHRDKVTQFVNNVYEQYYEIFGENATITTFGNSKNVQHFTNASDIEEKYTTALSNILQANPQPPSPQVITPPPVPRNVYYGTSPITKNQSKTFSEATSTSTPNSTQTQSSLHLQVQALTRKTNTLQKEINQSKPNSNIFNIEQVKNDIKKSVLESVEGVINDRMNQVDQNLEIAINEVKDDQNRKIASLQSLITTTGQKNVASFTEHTKKMEERSIMRENANTVTIIQQMKQLLEQNQQPPTQDPQTNASVSAVEHSSCHGVKR